MGHGFGELAYVRGIIKYSLSPFEQRAYAGAINPGIPQMFRRMRGHIFKAAPPLVLSYLIYDYVETLHEKLNRKNPKDYENDV